jgi:hypothetical protein
MTPLLMLILLVLLFCPQAQSIPVTQNAPVTPSNSKVVDTAIEPKPPVFSETTAVVKYYGPIVRPKLQKAFAAQNISYPPAEMTWLCLKDQKTLQLFAPDKMGKQHQILSYKIIGLSGKAGPKLKEGDKQVPEGFYRICGFRPNLIAHIGLSVNYPNKQDLLHARQEKRHNLGGDILIHGSKWSTGCLAMGNPAIEEMFVLAHDMNYQKINLIFAPCNLLTTTPDIDFKLQPKWLPALYKQLNDALKQYPIN